MPEAVGRTAHEKRKSNLSVVYRRRGLLSDPNPLVYLHGQPGDIAACVYTLLSF